MQHRPLAIAHSAATAAQLCTKKSHVTSKVMEIAGGYIENLRNQMLVSKDI